MALVHSRKITSTRLKKAPPAVAHNWRPCCVPEPLLFDFGLVNSIAGLGLAGLDVEIVLFISQRGQTFTAFGYTNGTWFQMIATRRDGDDKVVWAFTHGEPYLRRRVLLLLRSS